MPRPTLLTPPFIVDPHRHYSIEEWQFVEEVTGERYEYHQGKLISVRAMAGGSGAHALIGGNITGSLFKIVTKIDNEAIGNRCGVYSSDLRLMITPEDRYVYPDAAVVCGRPMYDCAVPTAVLNPLIVVEVLSPSSESYDTGEKFDYYATLKSLRNYVLIAQDWPRVEVRSRKSFDDSWTIQVTEGLQNMVTVSSLDDSMPMAEVYRLVEFG